MKAFLLLIGLITWAAAIPINGNVKDEYGDKFEGDIALTEEQKKVLFGHERNGLINLQRRWDTKIIPYTFGENAFNQEQMDYIDFSLQKLQAGSCLTFKRWEGEPDYVQFVGDDSGCWSYVGRSGGRQQINLTPYEPELGCFRSSTIQHEMLHALGFYHMQSATDRDNYVTIMWDNIEQGTQNNFQVLSDTTITHFGVPYDVGSVMHYGAYAFSKNGYATIVPHDLSLMNVIGQRIGLSEKDFERLNIMYNCNEN